ncbi:hypothetical protein AT6N2_C1436 [Agrobacterium tumefaciens]|nr:hypothetical protein AT6N2_C1436 [Agrobacterium tumefaciens]
MFDGLWNFALGGQGVDVEIDQILIHRIFGAGQDFLGVHEGFLSSVQWSNDWPGGRFLLPDDYFHLSCKRRLDLNHA